MKKSTGDKKDRKSKLGIEYNQNPDVRAYDQRLSMARALNLFDSILVPVAWDTVFIRGHMPREVSVKDENGSINSPIQQLIPADIPKKRTH